MKQAILIIALVLCASWVVAQTCEQKPEVTPFFEYDPNMVDHRIDGAVVVRGDMPLRSFKFGRFCDPNVTVTCDTPFEISIGEAQSMTGDTYQGIVSIAHPNEPVPVGLHYVNYKAVKDTYGFMTESEGTVLILSVEVEAPFLSPLPDGIEPCENCSNGY
jgi:hypothetical protein